MPASLLLCWFGNVELGGPDLFFVAFAVTLLAIASCTTIAMLRYNLYDVDRAASAAATYTVVTAVLVVIFSIVDVVAGVLLGADSALVAAVATAVCALALAPLRTRLQRHVDARLYPLRSGALAALVEHRGRVNAGTAEPEQLTGVLRNALRDPGLRVAYRLRGRSELIDGDGTAVDPGVRAVEVIRAGSQIGVLLPDRTPASRELLAEVASALDLEIVALRAEVGAALREVADSRTRLLHAGYAERRRLERDLHDGAQQRLVALGLTLRLAQRHLDDGSVDVDGLLDQSVAELGTAVAELRRIAHGLRPASLDDGLAAALHTLAHSVPLPVDLELCREQVPDTVATTAYFVASEALTNALKHARASRLGSAFGGQTADSVS